MTNSVRPDALARHDLLKRLKRHLLRTSRPRVQMFLLVLTTGLIGALTSTALLHLHLRIMPLRYGISVIVAWAGFLGLAGWWVVLQQRHWKGRSGSGRILRTYQLEWRETSASGDSASRPDALDWTDLLPFDDVLVWALFFIAGLLSVFFAAWYIASMIALAPELLSELFLDGVFSAGLFHRLSRVEGRHWTSSIFARTRMPFLWTLLLFVFLGYIAQHYAPEAVSMGGVLRHITQSAR